VFIIFSILYYKERHFIDASYYFFHAINSGFFHVEHGRLVLALSQLLPLILSWLSAPFQWVMVGASLGHELFYYAVFLLLYYGLKEKALGIGVILLRVVGQAWVFFVPMAEIYYGGALALLLYGLLKQDTSGKQNLGLILCLEWLILTSHPLNFLLVVAIISAYALHSNRSWNVLHFMGLFFIVGLIIQLFAADSYEKDKIQELGNGSVFLMNMQDKDYLTNLINYLLANYWEVFFLILLSFIISYRNKRKFSIELVALILSILTLVLANYRFPINQNSWYVEIILAPMVTITIMLLLPRVLKGEIYKSPLISIVTVSIVIYNLIYMHEQAAPLFKRMGRLELLTDNLQKRTGNRFIFKDQNLLIDARVNGWSNSVDMLLLSAIDGPEEVISVITEGEYRYEKNYLKVNDSSFVFRMFEVHPGSFLNERYFKMADGEYQEVNSTAMQVEPEQVWLDVPQAKLQFKEGDSAWAMVQVAIPENSLLGSLPVDNVYLTYRSRNQQGEEFLSTTQTPLTNDVLRESYQYLKILRDGDGRSIKEIQPVIVIGEKAYNANQAWKQISW
jgi:hypothetical protein